MAHLPKGKCVLPLPPFKAWLASNIPAVYDNTMTYYEELCALIKYLQSVVLPALNENAAAVTVISKAVEQLQKYVEDYFKNLDVQEEINNKLDEMAADGTLQEIIAPLITGEVEYIFPKMWVNGSAGDICIIKTPNKNIMIDTHASTKWTNVHDMLHDNDVTHIDVLIITHYDPDHYGNVNNLISYSYIDSNTTAYLSCIPEDFPQDYITAGNGVKLALEGVGASCIYPTEGQEVTIDSEVLFKIKFANCDAEAISAMTPVYTNNASMCCFITQKNIHSFIGGDSIYTVMDRLYNDLGYPKYPVELYKVGHHGFEYETNVNFVESLSPQYAVITAEGVETFATGLHGYTPEFSILSNLGCKIFACFDQSDYIKFVSAGNAMDCKTGVPKVFDNACVSRDIYVDINADKTEIQDGTQEHPFSEIAQALCSIPNGKCQNVDIHLADGDYHTVVSGNHYLERLRINGNKNTVIRLTGNSADNTAVTIDNLYITDSNVIINYVTLHTDRFDAIRAIRSNVILQNSIIEASDGAAHGTDGIYLTSNSRAEITNVSIKNVRNAFNIGNGSTCILTGSTTVYDHSSAVTYTSGGGELITNSYLHFDTASDVYNYSNYKIQTSSPVQIATTHTEFDSDVTLIKNVNSFKFIEVTYKSSDGHLASTGRIHNNGGGFNTYLFGQVKSGSNKVNIKTARLQISGTSAQILGGISTTINGSSISASDATGLFDIVAVYGYYDNDFIDVSV